MHLITKVGVKPNTTKINLIEYFPQPKDPKEIKLFLELSGHYPRYIPNFANISKLLTKF